MVNSGIYKSGLVYNYIFSNLKCAWDIYYILRAALLRKARNDPLTAFHGELFNLGIHLVVGALDLFANPQEVQTQEAGKLNHSI